MTLPQKISEHRFDKDFKDCYLCQAKVLWIGIEAKDQKGIRCESGTVPAAVSPILTQLTVRSGCSQNSRKMTRLSYATGWKLMNISTRMPGRHRVRDKSEDLPSRNFTASPAGTRAAAGQKFMKRIYRLIVSACFLGCGSVAFAQTSVDTTSVLRKDMPLDSVQVIKEAVIVGAPAEHRYREVIPAQTLKEEELQRLNSFSVADAIRYFSGVQLKDYGGVGGLKTVNIRSMGTNHMAVFYDGIQLGNAQNGQVDLGRFSLDDVEEISLHNGQKSDIFQSAKDFGASGTIYITTRRPRFEKGRNANFKATMKTGSFGLINPSIRSEYKISDAVSASFSGEWVNATGKYKFRYRRRNTLGEIVYDTTAVRHNGDINATRLEAALHGVMNEGRWTVRAYSYNSERGIPGAIVNNVFRNGERLWDTNSFIQGTFTNRWTQKFRSLVNAKYAADYTHYENQDAKLIQTKNTYRQKELYASCANLYNILDNWEVSLSYDFQWNTLDATFYMPTESDGTFPYPTRYTQMAALATAFEWGRFKGQASVLGYFVHEKLKRFEARPDKVVVTPAFFLSYKPFRRQDLSLRAFYKRMFRMPTFNDLYYTDMGNAFLKPEYAEQFNVGLKYTKDFRNMSVLRTVDASVDAYYNHITDKIIAYPKGQQFRWTMLNLGEVDIKGVDVALNTAWAFGEVEATARLQYTYQEAIDVTDPADTYYRGQIPYIPWHSGSAVLSLFYKGWGLNYSFIYTGERYNQQENIPRNHTQPWYTSDLSLQKSFAIRTRTLKLTAEINNLFGQDYDVVLNYPMPKTNFRFVTSFNF